MYPYPTRGDLWHWIYGAFSESGRGAVRAAEDGVGAQPLAADGDEAHASSIDVERHEEYGSTFRIRLPVYATEAPSLETTAE